MVNFIRWIKQSLREKGPKLWLPLNFQSFILYKTQVIDSLTVLLHIIFSHLNFSFGTGNPSMCWPYILGVGGIFMMVTMGAVLVTEGCRKIKLQYYGFKLASGAR